MNKKFFVSTLIILSGYLVWNLNKKSSLIHDESSLNYKN